VLESEWMKRPLDHQMGHPHPRIEQLICPHTQHKERGGRE
jgi:hypothetical protein